MWTQPFHQTWSNTSSLYGYWFSFASFFCPLEHKTKKLKMNMIDKPPNFGVITFSFLFCFERFFNTFEVFCKKDQS